MMVLMKDLLMQMTHISMCFASKVLLALETIKTQAADQLLHMRQTQHSNARELLSQTPANFPVPIIAKGPTSPEPPIRFAPTPTDQVATIAKKYSTTEVLDVPTINVGEVSPRPKTRKTDVPPPAASLPAPSVENVARMPNKNHLQEYHFVRYSAD